MRCGSFLLFWVIAAQIALLWWAHGALQVMREEWPRVVKALPARVYVIQHKQFWGPVNAIVPTRCREMDKWQKMTKTDYEVFSPVPASLSANARAPSLRAGAAVEAEPPAASTTAWSGPVPTPAPTPLPTPADSMRRLADDIVVNRCNETMHFEGVTHLHRYLSMISLSNHITGGTPTAAELHEARIRSHNALFVGIIICMILKYSLKITDILAECCGHQYVQLWNQGRTTFDKLLESLLLHGVSIIFTLAMQMTLCSLFLTFWREDHFIMTYVPGLGFSLFFGSLVLFCFLMVVDRLRGWMARASNAYIYFFWSCWVVWMLLFVVPMIGYCIYSVNFMWRARQMGWLWEQDDIFSKEFVHASVTVARATGCFLLVAVADFVVIILLDLDQHPKQSRGVLE